MTPDRIVLWPLVKRSDDPRSLGNEECIVCPLYNKPFILTYSDPELNKLNEWRRVASAALRDSHKKRHEEFPLELVWKVRLKR